MTTFKVFIFVWNGNLSRRTDAIEYYVAYCTWTFRRAGCILKRVSRCTFFSLEMPVPSQGHYGFHSFPVFDWFCLFIYLWVLTFPLEDYSEFGNFVITLIYKYTYYAHIISQTVCNNNKPRTMKNNNWMYYYYFPCTSGNVRIGDYRLIGMRKSNLNAKFI